MGLRRAARPARRPAPKTYLFGIEDDHSRFITGWWWTTREDVTGLFAALRRAVEAHGAPRAFYVDNGSPYVSRQLLHALADTRHPDHPLAAPAAPGEG